MRHPRLRLGLLACAAAVLLAAGGSAGAESPVIRPDTGEAVPFARMIDDLAAADVVLVGERHDDHAQHWVQGQIISGLLGRGPVALGLEAFASGKDEQLDRWRQGRFDSWLGFLEAVDWFRHWGVAPGLYRPILQTARRHRLPLTGMNVPRAWISRIARQGLDALSQAQRRRIGPVAEAPEAYAEALRESLAEHDGGGSASGFIAAQTAWDAAMAGALLDLRADHPRAVTVGLAGTGHIRGGHGIPHQLKQRRAELTVRTVMPYDPENGEPDPGDADYAWAVAAERAPEPVRIGAELGQAGDAEGIPVAGVRSGHPGPEAGLRQGDRILAVDGEAVGSATALIYRIRRHHWGGCLRLRIQRGDAEKALTVPLNRPPEAGR